MALYNLNLLPPEDMMRNTKDIEMEGMLVAQSNTEYEKKQVRNIIISENEASLDLMEDGDIWIKI